MKKVPVFFHVFLRLGMTWVPGGGVRCTFCMRLLMLKMLDPVTETTMKTAICTGDSWCLQVFLTRFVGAFWIDFAVSHHYSNHIFLQGSWWRLTPCHPSETDCAHPKPPKKQKTPNPQWYSCLAGCILLRLWPRVLAAIDTGVLHLSNWGTGCSKIG